MSVRATRKLSEMHCGILCDVADAAMGMAFVTTLGPVPARLGRSRRLNRYQQFQLRLVNTITS